MSQEPESTPPRSELDELRDLVAPDATRVADVLPDAITERSARDDKLGRALASTVERAIAESVQSSPETIADAIFPIIGPAIRKSISEAIRGMMQSLNQTLEQSVSVQGMRWRLEARRTSRPLAEVVMRHTLLYRVEHVFFIHRETGLPLATISADPHVSENAELISGMLSAIQEFVRESFSSADGETLDNVQMGDLTLHLRHGREALLAVMVRGTPPSELNAVTHEVLEDLYRSHGKAITEFSGDDAPFENTARSLRRCLISQEKTRDQGISPLIPAVALLTVLAVGAGVAWTWHRNTRDDALVSDIGALAGVVVVESERSGGQLYVRGLRDPMSVDPSSVISAHEYERDDVALSWEPYQALVPEIIAKRLLVKLEPPATVVATWREGSLRLSGQSSAKWLKDARARVGLLNADQLVDLEDVQTPEVGHLRDLVRSLAAHVVTFEPGAISPSKDSGLAAIRHLLGELAGVVETLECSASVELHGHTDTAGSADDNMALSEARARAVAESLSGLESPRVRFEAVAGGPLADARHAGGRVVYSRVVPDVECGAYGAE